MLIKQSIFSYNETWIGTKLLVLSQILLKYFAFSLLKLYPAILSRVRSFKLRIIFLVLSFLCKIMIRRTLCSYRVCSVRIYLEDLEPKRLQWTKSSKKNRLSMRRFSLWNALSNELHLFKLMKSSLCKFESEDFFFHISNNKEILSSIKSPIIHHFWPIL